MKSIRHALITGSLLASLSGLALAQNAPPRAPDTRVPQAERIEKMHQYMSERQARQLAELKSKLKLEPSQEGAWTAFAQSMQLPALPFFWPDPAALEKLTTPERLDQMQAHKAQRDALMQKHVDATKVFYAALNADQKKTFDTETAQAMTHLYGVMPHGGGRFGPR
ncbi:Spy/CpxP family protein refolding chaperone [Limnohabitans sp. T6-5]|uniref:Spy/CpxP family protein refolding chaperone n=1 Tax=Limnohabitans sp. T6-5 TaxID=1100724 RepID=UPI0013048FBF|nr:Spy/CpxP family protein refolding chaperone [Limnohabitans sp. T6-5]